MPDPSMGPDQGPDQSQEGPGGSDAASRFCILGAPTISPLSGGGTLVAGSEQTVFVPVALQDLETGAVLDPTGGTVEFAFTPGPDPVAGDWGGADWVTRDSDGAHFAAVGVSALAPCDYFVFVRTDGFVGLAGIISVL